jgi:hypothetical protein
MAPNAAKCLDVGLASVPASAESSSSWTTSSRQSDDEPVLLSKATGFPNPNVLPQVMTAKEKDIGGIYDKKIHRNNWTIDTCVPSHDESEKILLT